jgi:hypothetical protein
MISGFVKRLGGARNVVGSVTSAQVGSRARLAGRQGSIFGSKSGSMAPVRSRCERTASLVVLFAVARASALENRVASGGSASPARNPISSYDSTPLGSQLASKNLATCYCVSERPAEISGRRFMSGKTHDSGSGTDSSGQNFQQGTPSSGGLRGGSSSSHDFLERLPDGYDSDGRVEVGLPPTCPSCKKRDVHHGDGCACYHYPGRCSFYACVD